MLEDLVAKRDMVKQWCGVYDFDIPHEIFAKALACRFDVSKRNDMTRLSQQAYESPDSQKAKILCLGQISAKRH